MICVGGMIKFAANMSYLRTDEQIKYAPMNDEKMNYCVIKNINTPPPQGSKTTCSSVTRRLRRGTCCPQRVSDAKEQLLIDVTRNVYDTYFFY